jgi:hypothetical protein
MTITPPSQRPKVSAHEHSLLVPISKSKKLAAIANKHATIVPPNSTKPIASVSGLKSELEIELERAQTLIDTRIDKIMNSFPQGKRNSLFRFRYGSVAEIKSLAITVAFQRLDIHHPINTRLLENRNYHGDIV